MFSQEAKKITQRLVSCGNFKWDKKISHIYIQSRLKLPMHQQPEKPLVKSGLPYRLLEKHYVRGGGEFILQRASN